MKCRECLLLLEEFVEDGLEAKAFQEVEGHLSTCSGCARAHAELRSEQEMLKGYLLNVEASPDLWEGLRRAVQEEEAARRAGLRVRLRRSMAALSAKLLPTSELGWLQLTSASLVLVVGLIAFSAQRFDSGQTERAQQANGAAEVEERARRDAPPVEVVRRASQGEETTTGDRVENAGVQVNPSRQRRDRRTSGAPVRHDLHVARRVRRASGQSPASGAQARLVAGERAYLETIDRLKSEIEKRGEATLPPTLRAEYKRNLTIVDRSIADIRGKMHIHPHNPDLADFLGAAYRGKLNLLSSMVSQLQVSNSDF